MHRIRNGPDYLSTITAQNSLLLLLDYQQQDQEDATLSRLTALCDAAREVAMPIVLTAFGNNDISSALRSASD